MDCCCVDSTKPSRPVQSEQALAPTLENAQPEQPSEPKVPTLHTAGPELAWPKELHELVSVPSFAACLSELGVHSMADFTAKVDLEAGHGETMQAVLAALPDKPKKARQLRNRALRTLADLLLRLTQVEPEPQMATLETRRTPAAKLEANVEPEPEPDALFATRQSFDVESWGEASAEPAPAPAPAPESVADVSSLDPANLLATFGAPPPRSKGNDGDDTAFI